MASPLDQKVIDRFAALAGGKPCTQEEAALAVGISERQGRRLLARPEVQAKVSEARGRYQSAILDEARAAIDELLAAVEDDGRPDPAARARAAELLLRYREQFDAHDLQAAEDLLPEGVWRVYPTAFPQH